MSKLLLRYLNKPELYAPSTAKFWDDEHISKGMLEAHLNPSWDAASRNHEFIKKSVDWINQIAPKNQFHAILDLGCGPGLYTEQFYRKGYQVTGIDFSKRSIQYASEMAKMNKHEIIYHYMNYLDIDYDEAFDVITLIYCDYCVLPERDRITLMRKIYRALKSGGKAIVDVNTPNVYNGRQEEKRWTFESNGFWCNQPYLCLNAFYRYDNNIMLEQAVIVTEAKVNCYNIWDHTFTLDTLHDEFHQFGFGRIDYYGNVAGDMYEPEGNTICAVLEK